MVPDDRQWIWKRHPDARGRRRRRAHLRGSGFDWKRRHPLSCALPIYDDPQQTLADSGELVILRVVEADGEEFLETIDDEDEMDEIADIFMERLEEDYDVISEDEDEE